MSCVVGIDIGTTSTIGILLDTKTNKIIKKVSLKVDLFSPKVGWAEENPNQWWSNTKKILIKLIQYSKLKKKKIIALGVTGMLPALVILDKNGKVIRNSIQQSDGRTGKQIRQLFNYKIQKWFVKKTKCGVNQQLIAPKLLWLKQNEKNNFKKIHTIFGSYDFINFKLTGKYSIEHNWALESGLMDFKKKKFTSDLVKLGSIKLSMLPKIFPSDHILGNISENLSKELSLDKNVIRSAISSGVPTLPINCLLIKSFSFCLGLLLVTTLFLQEGVFTVPGKITLQRIFCFAKSNAKDFVNPIMAAFVPE